MQPKYNNDQIDANSSRSIPTKQTVKEFEFQSEFPENVEENKNESNKSTKSPSKFDYSDRMIKHLSKGSIENQIEQLYNDYLLHKKAYKMVLGIYKGVLDPIYEQSLE